jgi:hypothetical protein
MMTPDEREQAFLTAVEEQLEQHPSPPEGANARQAEDWFRGIIDAIRPKLVPKVMPLATFDVWKRTLRRTYQFQVPWHEARQKTDIILRQELLERLQELEAAANSESSGEE